MQDLTRNDLQQLGRSSIFLSHCHSDKSFVNLLAMRLKCMGIETWVDTAVMRIGDSLIDKIQEGINSVDYLGVVLTPESVASKWVNQELKAALSQEILSQRVKVLPILYKDCDIPLFLKDKIYADFRNCMTDQHAFNLAFDFLVERLLPEHELQNKLFNEALKDMTKLWMDFAIKPSNDQMEFLYSIRNLLNISPESWLMIAECAASHNTFDNWCQCVTTEMVWNSLLYIAKSLEFNSLHINLIKIFKRYDFSKQIEFVDVISKLLLGNIDKKSKTMLIKSINRPIYHVIRRDIMQIIKSKSTNTETDAFLIVLTGYNTMYFELLGLEFFMIFLEEGYLIGDEVFYAIKAVGELGNSDSLPFLRALLNRGCWGNDAICCEYVSEIESNIKRLTGKAQPGLGRA